MKLWPLVFCLPAIAADSIFVDPSRLRVVRMPGIAAEATPGGDKSPEVGSALFLTLPGSAVHLDRVDELRAPIPPSQARTFAGLVASAEPLVATLEASTGPLAVTTGTVSAPMCHRATMERFSLTLTATGTVLTGQRVLLGTETDVPGACGAWNVRPP